MRVWIDPETVFRALGLGGSFPLRLFNRSAEFGLAPMFTIIFLVGLAYLVIGIGCTMMSLHELATAGRNRLINRLIAWSNVVLWLPMVLIVAIAVFLDSQRSVQRRAPSMAERADAILAERRTLRRVARQG